MKSTQIFRLFWAILALCGLLACSRGAPDGAEILSQLENADKVEAPVPRAAGPSDPEPPPPNPASGNRTGDAEAFLAPASTAGDPVPMAQPPIVAELPSAAASLPPPPPPPAQDNIAMQNSQDTISFQIQNPNAVDSISMATVPYQPVAKFDTVTMNPNFVDAVPMTIGDYCENKLSECKQQATGPAPVCYGAFNGCMDPGNCAVRYEVCTLNHKTNCIHDAEVCFFEDKCRRKKIACVTDTQETVQCEGDRQACNARIEGHLANCSSTKDRCLKEGGGSQECYQEYDYCKTNMSL